MDLPKLCSDSTQHGLLKQSGHLSQIKSTSFRVKRHRDRERNEHKHSIQTVHITRKQVSYLKILVFDKPNKELKLAMKMQKCVKTMSQMRALGILGSRLLKNHMVRCLKAAEALLLLPRGAH